MSRSNPYDLSEGRKGFKSGIREHCQCQYCEHQRQEEAQGPRPGRLQREFDAARKATAPPAAGPWIKIEPGGEMPEVGAWKRSGPLIAIVEEGGDRRVVSCHYSEGHKYISDGFKCYGAAITPIYYAVVRMPEAK